MHRRGQNNVFCWTQFGACSKRSPTPSNTSKTIEHQQSTVPTEPTSCILLAETVVYIENLARERKPTPPNSLGFGQHCSASGNGHRALTCYSYQGECCSKRHPTIFVQHPTVCSLSGHAALVYCLLTSH